MQQYCQITQKSRIGNYKLPYCSHEEHHQDYNVTEVCVEKGCPDNFRPLCIKCKFESHKNDSNHKILPIKHVLDNLSDELQKERDKIIILQAKNSPIFDKWDQTEQILKETIKTSQTLIDKVKLYQEYACKLLYIYQQIKLKLGNRERVDVSNKALDQLLIDTKYDSLCAQLINLKKQVFIQDDKALSFFSQTEHDNLIKQQEDKKEQIFRFTQILNATYHEVSECFQFANIALESDQYGMSWFQGFKANVQQDSCQLDGNSQTQISEVIRQYLQETPSPQKSNQAFKHSHTIKI